MSRPGETDPQWESLWVTPAQISVLPLLKMLLFILIMLLISIIV